MSPAVAFFIVTWAAIIVLFFGLAAVLREVRLLRGLVVRNSDGFATELPELSLGAQFARSDVGNRNPGNGNVSDGNAGNGGVPHSSAERIVVAVDSGCPLCLAVVERLAARSAEATLLTHEPPAVWDDIAGQLPIISDRESWRAVAHLSPPVLMLIDDSGSVRKMMLPVRVAEVDNVLADWTG